MPDAPALTRRLAYKNPESWHIYYEDIRVGTISERSGAPHQEDQWSWYLGFYPGPPPGTQIVKTARTFEDAREAFGKAWPEYLAARTEAEFEKYRQWQRDQVGRP